MSDGNDFNERNIAEFRAKHGRVGGPFEGAPLVVLHTVGARSGKPRTNIMMYLADGERYLVFASNNGADDNPAWYWNLKATPMPASKSATTSSTCMPPTCRVPNGTTSTRCRPSGIQDSLSMSARHRGSSRLSRSRLPAGRSRANERPSDRHGRFAVSAPVSTS